MLRSQNSRPDAAPSVDPLDHIAATVRALVAPSASLYYECNRERIERHVTQLAVLDLELTALRKRAFAAGARLMSLRQQRATEGAAP